tara:strand:- start:134 stop:259 length:126 start_codon:yes stop_codon:yes gene_type:complete
VELEDQVLLDIQVVLEVVQPQWVVLEALVVLVVVEQVQQVQ